ncbi:PH domain-containing protein [Streptomyces sp. NPDC006512]|uniref:PH domain-containing protein n=1 Tax=Streptomyces sp. NPDC006512 TaxID=3154307 RepID=UPI0033A8722E
MGAGLLPRDYRVRAERMTGAYTAVGIGAPGVLLSVLTMEHVAPGVKPLIAAPVLALFGWLVWASRRCSTLLDRDGIRVRRLTGSRRLAWADVQEIRAAPRPGAAAAKGRPPALAYAHDRAGRRLRLVCVDDGHVDVAREVALIRTVWRELRGPDWAPDPEARRAIGRQTARERRGAAQAWGRGALCLLFVAGMALLALGD